MSQRSPCFQSPSPCPAPPRRARGQAQHRRVKMAAHRRHFRCFDALLDDPSQCSSPHGPPENAACCLCPDPQHGHAHRKPTWPDEAPPTGQQRKRLVLVKNSDPAVRRSIVLHQRALRSLRLFLEEASELLRCHIRKLYTLDGRKIDSVQGLMQCLGVLVCVGQEPFHPLLVESFRTTSEEKLPRVPTKSRSIIRTEGQECVKNVNFGLETKKSIIHPRSDSTARSPRHSLSSEKSFPNGLNSMSLGNSGYSGSCPHVRESITADDIEKKVIVNKNGSLSVEMKVRFHLLNNETLQWSTEVKKSPGTIKDQAHYLQQSHSESWSETDSISTNEAEDAYITKLYQRHLEDPHCQYCCAHCLEYEIWKSQMQVDLQATTQQNIILLSYLHKIHRVPPSCTSRPAGSQALPNSCHSSVQLMKVLLSPKLYRCNSLPEVSPVYGRKLSNSAKELLDCLANLQLIDSGSAGSNAKDAKYEELMNILQSLWLTGPSDSEQPKKQKNKLKEPPSVEEEFTPRSSSGVDVSSGSVGSGKSSVNGNSKTQKTQSAAEARGKDQDEQFKLLEEPEENEEEIETDPQNDISSGTPPSVQRAQVAKKVSPDTDPVWVLNLLNKLEKQFMTHYVNAMTDFKIRWNLEDNEQLDTMINELKDVVHKRIRSSIDRELKKIQSCAGKVPRPPKKALSRESTTQTELRRRQLKAMRNQSIDTEKSDEHYTATGTELSDQPSEDEYCPCDTCMKKKIQFRPAGLFELVSSAPAMMDFDLRKILHLKKEIPTNIPEERCTEEQTNRYDLTNDDAMQAGKLSLEIMKMKLKKTMQPKETQLKLKMIFLKETQQKLEKME
ncbi:retinitis pigmentosa 1-like 1 protein [Anguilla anguilla]|uniref:retinitis pigmentosa 1-like 1 protein n=1 Tax=Anguilla anguilla TaxID=7936 RepID=UPI0015B21B9B|nr:retinitis pigmentosa 1-like 1 protein [Anguilla anguilla]